MPVPAKTTLCERLPVDVCIGGYPYPDAPGSLRVRATIIVTGMAELGRQLVAASKRLSPEPTSNRLIFIAEFPVP